jgi:spermidine/putrescine transport system permease protein
MTTLSSPERVVGSSSPPDAPSRRRRRGRKRLGDRLLFAWTWLIVVWLALPIAVMIMFSFNDPRGRYNFTWVRFTLKWYGPHLFDYPSLTAAMQNSLLVALASTLISVVLGTLIGLALGKYRFRGVGAANLVQFAAISAPEIVLASSLLSFFVTLRVPLGLPTIVVAHVMFCLSFVAVTVRSRVLTLDRSLEEAARDLGAGPWTTFRLVTLPLIFPGVLRNGLPPQVDVLGTLIFAFGLLLVAGSALFNRRGNR